MELTTSVHARGGLAATFELHDDGHTRNGLRAATSGGTLIRVRQGWYALPGTQPELLQAARVGGRLSCLSGLRLHGVWQYPTDFLHVSVVGNACRLRQPGDKTKRLQASAHVRVHWRDREPSGSRLLLTPVQCLSDLLCCEPPEVVLTAVDSALHNRLIDMQQWRKLLDTVPHTTAGALPSPDPRCESGIETLTRIRLTAFGLPLRSQVQMPGVGRVDFMVGNRLVIEVDGAEYHTDPERFEADRKRDALLSARGVRVLRFSYRQVLFRWHEVENAVLAAVIRGDHH